MATADTAALTARFLAAPAVAVAGASNDPTKFGAKVFACCVRHFARVYPLNPNTAVVQGVAAFARIADLPERVLALSVITPPAVTLRLVEEAAAAGVEVVWMQPGAESARAVARAAELGMAVIHGGPCILVELGCP